MSRTVMIVGPGRMGLALAGALAEVEALDEIVVCGRHADGPDHPTLGRPDVRYVFGLEQPRPGTVAVLLAVPDSEIAEVAHALASMGPAPEGCVVFHLSGALPTDILEPLYRAGYPVGVLHPMVSIVDSFRDRAQLRGAALAVTGGPDVVASARTLAGLLGAHVLPVPAGRRPLQQAATVLGGSMLLPLLARSVELMQRAGVDGDEALGALLAQVKNVVASVESGGVPESVRGPIANGDVETVAMHLRALEEDEARLYATIGLETLRLAQFTLEPEVADELRALFGRYVHLEMTEAGS